MAAAHVSCYIRSIMNRFWTSTPAKPPMLMAGDRVAIVTPCWGGPSVFPHRYEAGKQQLKDALGLDVIEMPHARADAAWLDANPKARADDLMAAFVDPEVKGIIASIGGDDTIRLIPHVDLNVIAENPKAFLGYSDTTVIGFLCLKAGLISFYGPTIMSGFAENGGPSEYMISAVKNVLFSDQPAGPIRANREGWTVERLDWSDPGNQNRRRVLQPSSGPRVLRGTGEVQGRLIGGCAETIETLKGTEWWPPLDYWRGAILFYETSEEQPSPVQVGRWLRNFAAQGILQVINGILLARPGGYGLPLCDHASYDAAVLQALNEAGLDRLAVLANLDFGHTDPIFTLPFGAQAEIDCDKTELTLLESAVRKRPHLATGLSL